jgi:hypothetical protein
MIDPITIGIAFTAAQQAVGGIKKAIALGKDVTSLYGQFAKFFENADKVHSANVEAQGASTILTDSQIRSMSLQIAMHSKALHDAERELKDILYYSGNADIWKQMMAERVRMYKERARLEAEKKEAEAKAKADLIDRVLIFVSFVAIAIPVLSFSFAMILRK